MRGSVVRRRLCAAALACAMLLIAAVPAAAAGPPDNSNAPPTAGPPPDPGAQGGRGPSVPTGLVATPLHEAVRLSWSATVDRKVVTLRVQRDGAEVAALPATDTTWLDSGLVAGRLYRYTMTAVDDRGVTSPVSAPVEATPLDLVAPPAPVAPTATPGDTEVTITWTPVADAGLAGYRLYQDGVAVRDVPAGTTTAMVAGLTNGREYRFAISAFDAAGNESPLSPDVAVTPRDMTPPPVPTGLSAAAGDGAATLQWNAVSASDLAGYRLYQDGALIRELDAATLSALIEGLVNDTEVAYTVSAVDAAGNESAQSPPVAVIPRDTTPPAVPLNLSAEPGDAEATLLWDAVVADDLAGYRVYQDGLAVRDVAAGTLSATIAELTNGQQYRFTVAAFDLAGNESALSDAALVTPVDRTPPPVPTGLAGAPGDSEATLTWDAVDAPDLAWYRVYLDGDLVATVPAGTTTETLRSLVNGTEYLVSVAAEDAVGNRSERSPAISVRPRDLTPPPVPEGLTATPGDQRVTLSWDPVTDDGLAGYRLYVDGLLTREVAAPATTVDVWDLVNGKTYSVTITAFDVAGNESAASTPPVMFVPVAGPPAPLVFDDFNRADGELGVAPVSELPWHDFGGGVPFWRVRSQQATGRSQGTTTTQMYALVDPDIADGTVAATINAWQFDFSRVGLVFRATDAANLWRAERTFNSASGCDVSIRLVRRTAGVDQGVAEKCDVTLTAGSRLQVSMSGSTIKVLLNGTEILEAVDAFNATATLHGMRAATDDVLDDFEIAGPANAIAPTVPTGLTVVNGDGAVTASWNAVGDNDVAGYRVYRDGVEVAEVDAATTSAVVPGLVAGTTYAITVTAVDTYGNESPHAITVRTTPGSQLVFDDFNRPDGDLGVAPVSGLTWTDFSGAVPFWRVQSQQATGRSQGTVTTPMYALVDPGIADGTVAATIRAWHHDISRLGLVFRAVDAANLWRAERASNSASGCNVSIRLIKRTAGVDRVVAEKCQAALTAGSRLQVSMSGSTIKVVLDGTEILDAVDTFNATATRHGLRAATNDMLDDFEITSAP